MVFGFLVHVMAHFAYLVVHRRKTSCSVRWREKEDNGHQVLSPFVSTGWLNQPACKCNVISSTELRDLFMPRLHLCGGRSVWRETNLSLAALVPCICRLAGPPASSDKTESTPGLHGIDKIVEFKRWLHRLVTWWDL